MSTVFAEITMSLDGYVAGEDITIQQPMGNGGIRLHEWIFDKKTLADNKLVEEFMNESGAFIVGNRTYSTAINTGWNNRSPFLWSCICRMSSETIPDCRRFYL